MQLKMSLYSLLETHQEILINLNHLCKSMTKYPIQAYQLARIAEVYHQIHIAHLRKKSINKDLNNCQLLLKDLVKNNKKL